MADAEPIQGGVPRNEPRRDAEVPLQVRNVVRRRLLLVLVAGPPFTPQRYERLSKKLQVGNLLVRRCRESCFGATIYKCQLV